MIVARPAVGRLACAVLLLLLASHGSNLSAQVSDVSPEDVLKAAFDVRKASDVADKTDADAIEYCGSTHRALVTSSDVEESISEYLLKSGQHVGETVLASNVWTVRNRASGVLHFVILNALECDSQAGSKRGSREVGARAMDAAANLAKARETLGHLALQLTKRQEGESPMLDPVVRGPVKRVSSETLLKASAEMEAAAQAADSADLDAASGRCDPSKGTLAADLQKDISDYLSAPGSHAPAYIPASNIWFVTRHVLAGEFHAATGAAICTLYAKRKRKALDLATRSYEAYKRLQDARERFEGLALQQTRWEEQQAIREQ
jgi:hypothetical protein